MKKNVTYQFLSYLLLLSVLGFSCSPKYGAYYPKKIYEKNSKAVNQVPGSSENLTASTEKVVAEEEVYVEAPEIQLVETIEISEETKTSVVEPAEKVKEKRGVLQILKKQDKNAVMTEREELILDALSIKLKGMSKAEKRAFRKEVKEIAKGKNTEKISSYNTLLTPEAIKEPGTNTLLLVILAVLIPPLAVGLHEGALNGTFWLNLLLTILFYIPGLIHALIVIL